jgi:hypothetical protein
MLPMESPIKLEKFLSSKQSGFRSNNFSKGIIMTKLMTIVMSLFIAAPAFASDINTIEDEINVVTEAFQLDAIKNKPDPRKVCRGLDLSDEQKTEIRTAMGEAKTAGAEVKEAFELNQKAYYRAVVDSGSSRAAVVLIDAETSELASSVASIRTGFRSKVLFDIVQQEKRVHAAKCMHAISKAHKLAKLKKICKRIQHRHPRP